MIINENGWGDKPNTAQKQAEVNEVKEALKAKKLKKDEAEVVVEENAEQE